MSYARPAHRRGPGAGRPAKLYRRAEREFVARVPPRDYELLATVLVRSAAQPGVADAIDVVAREVGRAIAAARSDEVTDGVDGVVEVLRERGYEPYVTAPGTVRLRDCPFRPIARSPTPRSSAVSTSPSCAACSRAPGALMRACCSTRRQPNAA